MSVNTKSSKFICSVVARTANRHLMLHMCHDLCNKYQTCHVMHFCMQVLLHYNLACIACLRAKTFLNVVSRKTSCLNKQIACAASHVILHPRTEDTRACLIPIKCFLFSYYLFQQQQQKKLSPSLEKLRNGHCAAKNSTTHQT